MEISAALVEEVRASLPELQPQMHARFVREYGLSERDAEQLTASKESAVYFEACVRAGKTAPKLAANWITGALAATLNREGLRIECSPVGPERLAGLLERVEDGTLSGKMAHAVFDAMWNDESDADEIIRQKSLTQLSDTDTLDAVIETVLSRSQKQIEQYRAGKTKVFGYFVGQVMKETGGRANPGEVNRLLKKRLGE